MFGRKKHETTGIATLVGGGTTVTGNVEFQGRVHVDGAIEGDVTGEAGRSVLAVGTDGVIAGTVEVDTLVLSGTVRGDVVARERVELGPTARVDGNVMYQVLQMSAGACVNGRLVHQPGAQQALPAPEAEQDEAGDVG